MSKELHITRSLWRDLYATAAISEAARILELIMAASPEEKWPLWISFVITYTKPFTANDEMGRISDKCIPEELRSLHTSFMMARNLLYGHTSPIETLDDGHEANQIFIQKREGEIEVVTFTLCPDDCEIPKAKRLLAIVGKDLIGRTETGRKAFEAVLHDKPDGNYKFSYPRKKNEPNKAVEPTPVAVTPPADAGGAPSTSAAHLSNYVF